MMKKKNIMTDLMFQGSFIMLANGDMTRMRYSGENWKRHRQCMKGHLISQPVPKSLVGTAAAAY